MVERQSNSNGVLGEGEQVDQGLRGPYTLMFIKVRAMRVKKLNKWLAHGLPFIDFDVPEQPIDQD